MGSQSPTARAAAQLRERILDIFEGFYGDCPAADQPGLQMILKAKMFDHGLHISDLLTVPFEEWERLGVVNQRNTRIIQELRDLYNDSLTLDDDAVTLESATRGSLGKRSVGQDHALPTGASSTSDAPQAPRQLMCTTVDSTSHARCR